jgi:hypothetical protein
MTKAYPNAWQRSSPIFAKMRCHDATINRGRFGREWWNFGATRACSKLMARTFLLALALLCSTGGRLNAAPADAGAAPASQPATAPASSIDRDPAEGMLLNDARDAAGELALAQHLERQHDWAKAAVEYQELLAAYGNRVFPSRLDPDNLAIQYANFGRYIAPSTRRRPRRCSKRLAPMAWRRWIESALCITAPTTASRRRCG